MKIIYRKFWWVVSHYYCAARSTELGSGYIHEYYYGRFL